MKITTVDYAILGLLSQGSKTGYAIRMIFDTTAMGIYSSSPGTIYPALKRMQKWNLVEKTIAKGDTKLAFAIASKGVEELKVWLSGPVSRDDVAKRKELLFLRFAFMEDLLPLEEKQLFVSSFESVLKQHVEELETYFSTQVNSMPLNGRLAFQHGLLSAKSTLKWCEYAKGVLSA